MKQISSYQAGCKLFNYASWNLLISCFSSFTSSVGPMCVGGLATSLSSMSYICLRDDLCHCDKLKQSDWWSTVNLLFHEVFAGVVAAILTGLNSYSDLIKMHDWGRQQAHAVNSKEAVYNLTQTSVLIRHSCSETAL